jgi:hypothetical protein
MTVVTERQYANQLKEEREEEVTKLRAIVNGK